MKTKLLLPAIVIPFFFAACKSEKTEEVKTDGEKAVAEAIENAEATASEAGEAIEEAAEEAVNEVEEAAETVEEALEDDAEETPPSE